jgi:peptidoglycan/LPS O-acetylase OafA/YrhL
MTRTRVNELDLFRFFAALAVVFFHYSFRGYAADDMSVMPYPLLAPFSKYGYLGFEFFFMISGFVILMTAASGSLHDFVVSRVVRLYPTFWACCTITFAVTIAIGAPRYSASISQYFVNMTLLSGFVGVPSIDGVYWSLFVEMQFYALVALVLVIGRIHQAQLFLIFWLVASIALEILPMHVLRYLLMVDYSAFFIAGAVFFLIWSKGLTRARAVIIALSWCLAIFQSTNKLSGFEKHYNTSMSSCVVAGIISTFFVVMFLVSAKRTGKFGRKRWMLAGAVTYPLYLLHQNIGFMIFNIAYPAINPHLLLWGTIAAVLGTAFVVHILIEKRFSLPMKYAISDLTDHLQHLVMRPSGRP